MLVIKVNGRVIRPTDVILQGQRVDVHTEIGNGTFYAPHSGIAFDLVMADRTAEYNKPKQKWTSFICWIFPHLMIWITNELHDGAGGAFNIGEEYERECAFCNHRDKKKYYA